jgi:hypothetical protein
MPVKLALQPAVGPFGIVRLSSTLGHAQQAQQTRLEQLSKPKEALPLLVELYIVPSAQVFYPWEEITCRNMLIA